MNSLQNARLQGVGDWLQRNILQGVGRHRTSLFKPSSFAMICATRRSNGVGRLSQEEDWRNTWFNL